MVQLPLAIDLCESLRTHRPLREGTGILRVIVVII